MSAMNLTNPKATSLLLLMGALLFSLSSLPGGVAPVEGSTDLMSERVDNCRIEDKLKRTGTAECYPEQGTGKEKVSGKIEIRALGKENQPVTKIEDAALFVAEGKVTLDCKECVEKLEETITVEVSDHRNIVDELKRKLNEKVKAMRATKKAAKDLANCVVDEEGDKLDEYARKQCILEKRLEKYASLEGKEAANYYKKHLQKLLKEMMASQDPETRRDALAALQTINDGDLNCANTFSAQENVWAQGFTQGARREKLEPKEYVEKSSCELIAFGSYNHDQQRLQILAKSGDAATRAQALSSLKLLNQTRGVHLQAAGYDVAQFAQNAGFGSILSGEVKDFNTELRENLKAIEADHQEQLRQTSGRGTRGTVYTNGSGSTQYTAPPTGPRPQTTSSGVPGTGRVYAPTMGSTVGGGPAPVAGRVR